MSIADWIGSQRSPQDFYELLGLGRFDPNSIGVASAIRAATRELMSYQNHRDAAVARRAAKLLWELGRAREIIADAAKLRQYHRDLMVQLRDEYARGHGTNFTQWDTGRLADWLSRQGVHRGRCLEVAEALTEPEPDIDSLPALVPNEEDEAAAPPLDPKEFVATVDDIPVLQLAGSGPVRPEKPAPRHPQKSSSGPQGRPKAHTPKAVGALLEVLDDPELANMGITPVRVAVAAVTTLVLGFLVFVWYVWPRGTVLNIGTFPAQATIFVNGASYGTGPISLRTSGRATIAARLEGYADEQVEVELTGARKDVSLVLKRLPARYAINLQPAHAELTLSGVEASINRTGTAPVLVVTNPDGKRTLTIMVRCPGYLPEFRELVPQPGIEETLEIHLELMADRARGLAGAGGNDFGAAEPTTTVPAPPPQMAAAGAAPGRATNAGPAPPVRTPAPGGSAAPPSPSDGLADTVWRIANRGGSTQIWVFKAGGSLRRVREDPNLASQGSWTQSGDEILFTISGKVPVRYRGKIVADDQMEGTATPLVPASSKRRTLVEKPNARTSWTGRKLKDADEGDDQDANAERSGR